MTPDNRTVLDRLLTAIAAAEAGPCTEDLLHAPKLDLWRPVVTPGGVPALWGRGTGHPLLTCDRVLTSQLIGLDAEDGWARTASRWYVLGSPFAVLELDIAHALGMKTFAPGFIRFDLPGCLTIDDFDELADLLAEGIERIRRIDAEDRIRNRKH
ncbi:DUF6634 family protein [Pseudogemmobacter sonorensis]|uniref:DUF6634 family protein n=1 Tax=Pseudogemmobacter sonorensis TaxID=2989681 RepID=UPI0036B31F2A